MCSFGIPENKMNYRQGVPLIHLKIGQVVVAREKVIVRTILGSCVSVVMWVPSFSLGMISHSMYPGRGEDGDCRYTINAIERMRSELDSYGLTPRKVQVKLFGGGLQLIREEALMSVDVQSDNVDSARQELARQGFTIIAQDVGGYYSREILFYTSTGVVLHKKNSVQSRLQKKRGDHE